MQPPDSQSNESHEIRLLKRLLECTRLLNATLDLRELTRIVLQIIHEELAFERGTVFVIDAEKRFLRSFVAQGVEAEIMLPVGTGVAGSVAETGEILDIPDAAQDSRFRPEFGEKLSFKVRDFFCMPIVNGDGVRVGVLQLLNRTRPVSERDKEFLASISVHLGIALERAWFHHQLKEKHEMEQEIRRVQHELAQLEKLSLIGTLTSGLLHEVRNPLTVLVAQTTLMKEDPRLPDGLAARLTIIEYSAQRAMEVVRNFLGFSRKDEGTRVPASINELIRKTMDLVAHECNKHKVSVESSLAKVPPVRMNVGEVQQVLLNLFKNALDAISQEKPRGSITVSTHLSVDGETVRVEIADDGPGIPEEHQARLFEPFYTTKPKESGTGLGLSTCRRLIEMHGGRIGFQSILGQGTTFWFELPLNPVAQTPVSSQLTAAR
jgi:signal transduction histidine kinase